MIEPFAFAEIGIAHAASVPWTESVTLIVTREPRATLAESMLATGARFVVGYDRQDGRDGQGTTGWPRRLPDWPKQGSAVSQLAAVSRVCFINRLSVISNSSHFELRPCRLRAAVTA